MEFAVKKLMLSTWLLIVCLGASGLVNAQGKIAVLDLQQAILGTEEAKAQIEKLQKTKEYGDNKKDAEKLRKEYENLVEQFNKDREVMSQEQQEEQAKRINSLKDDFEHVAKKLQQSELEVMQRVFQQMAPRAKQVVADLIKVEGIGLLLDAKAALHADVGYSINAKVTDKLNQNQP